MSDYTYDRAYYAERGATERALAAAAANPKVAAIHLEMAERYDQLAAVKAPVPAGRPTLRLATISQHSLA